MTMAWLMVLAEPIAKRLAHPGTACRGVPVLLAVAWEAVVGEVAVAAAMVVEAVVVVV